jgi:hypothetical protein
MNPRLLTAALALVVTATNAGAQVIYSNIPATTAGNYASQPYQAQQTSEFGNLLHLGAGSRDLSQVSILMSTWAIGSTYPALFAANSNGWTHNFTLNLYNVGAGNSVGSLISTTTQNSLIAWRPEHDAQCGNNTAWDSANDNACYNGLATRLDFNFASGTVILPNDVIVGLAFNTQSYGSSPMGVSGPYNSLNWAVGPSTTTAGSDDADVAYINRLQNPGFQRESGWGDYAPMVEVTAVVATPEPATMGLLATGLIGIAGIVRRRKKAL